MFFLKSSCFLVAPFRTIAVQCSLDEHKHELQVSSNSGIFWDLTDYYTLGVIFVGRSLLKRVTIIVGFVSGCAVTFSIHPDKHQHLFSWGNLVLYLILISFHTHVSKISFLFCSSKSSHTFDILKECNVGSFTPMNKWPGIKSFYNKIYILYNKIYIFLHRYNYYNPVLF